jgi:hypothetical protein
MMVRESYLKLTPETVDTKEEAFTIESGYNGLTAKVFALGEQALVVGANGAAYEKARWADSNTFRRNDQINKLFSDNQTRAYDQMSAARKRLIEEWTWGSASSPSYLMILEDVVEFFGLEGTTGP